MKDYAAAGLRHRLKQSGLTCEQLAQLSGVPLDVLTRVLQAGEPCPRKYARPLLMIAYQLPDSPDGPKFAPAYWLTQKPDLPVRTETYGHFVSESTEDPPLPAEPTRYPVGSLARVEVMAQRAARGEAIRHPRDESRHVPPVSGVLAKA